MDTFTFGALITREMDRQGKRLEDVAKLAGISIQYLSDIRRGRRDAPEATAINIGRALGVQDEWVYYLIGVLPPDLRGRDLHPLVIADGYAAMRRALRVKDGE